MTSFVGGEVLLLIAALGVLTYLGLRQPTILLLLVLASFAISPEAAFGAGPLPFGLNVAHKALLVVALAANVLKFGLRPIIPWPVICLAVMLLYNLTLSDLHRQLSLGMMLSSALTLAVPWLFPNVILEPGSRRIYAIVLSTTCAVALVAALGVVLQGEGTLMEDTYAGFERLTATGNANELSVLALAGCLVAGHELLRRRDPIFGLLMIANIVVLLLSGSRGAFAAGAVFAIIYVARSRRARETVRTYRKYVGLALLALAPLLAYAMAAAFERSFLEHGDAAENFRRFTTGRDRIWGFYVEEFQLAPMLGRGIGIPKAAPVGFLEDERIWSPHNEYLHILASGGIVGLVLFVAAVGAWFTRLTRLVDHDDRIYVQAAAGSLAVFAMVENVLLLPAMYPFYAYLGVLMTRSVKVRRRAGEGHGATAPPAVAETRDAPRAVRTEPSRAAAGGEREVPIRALRSKPSRRRRHGARQRLDEPSPPAGRRG